MAEETERTKALVTAFIAATTLEQRLAHVVRSPRTEARMGEFYERHPSTARAVFDFPVIAHRTSERENYFIAQALMVDGTKADFVIRSTTDGLKIDWESHVGYSEMEWADFLNRRPAEEKEMRVRAEISTHYEPPHDDRAEFLPLLLTRPGSERILRAVASKTETAGVKELAKQMLKAGPRPLTLSLAYPAGAKDTDFPIAEVRALISPDWLAAPAADQ